MTGAETRRRGWCPGALRPMQSGDGLLVRVKPSCGILTLAQAEAIAGLAHRYGNGLVELTSRGNLQLRGVRADTLDALIAALDKLELLDATPEAESVRNVISSPLAGMDGRAFDTRPVVKALEQRLTSDTALTGLSDKFGFLVDGGGVLPLDDVEADIRFVWRVDHFAIGVAREQGCDWIGTCAPASLPDAAIALARAFLSHADGAGRFRHLSDVRRHSIAKTAGVETWGQTLGSDPMRNDSYSADQAAAPPNAIGIVDGGGGNCVAGAGLPYGGSTSEALLNLVGIARDLGAGELRLTPWRAIVIPAAGREAAASILSALATCGFITDPADPRRAIAACPGAPACASGTTPIRSDADAFARAASGFLGHGVELHVSGCAKGCAHRQPAALTVVAENGAYGLVVNGAASNTAFGRFTAPEIAEILARVPSAVTKAGDASYTSRGAAIAAALKEILAA